jgi:outer membrane lipoprotein
MGLADVCRCGHRFFRLRYGCWCLEETRAIPSQNFPWERSSVRQALFRCAIVTVLAVLSGCSSGPAVIPKEFESQIDTSISFPELLAASSSYSGRTVLLGGEILSAKRMSDGTQFEILQLPVSKDNPPAERRSESQGRFLAISRKVIDPAAVPAGTRVTVIGYVTGDAVQRLDESEYRYPTIEVRHLHAWASDTYERRRYSSLRVGIFSGVGFGIGSGGRSGSFGGVGIGTGF